MGCTRGLFLTTEKTQLFLKEADILFCYTILNSGVVVSDSAGPIFDRNENRRIWDRNGSRPGFVIVTSTAIHKVFQYDCYSQVFNKNACKVSVLRKRGPGVTYVNNATSEHIKAGLCLRAHTMYALSRIWDHHTGVEGCEAMARHVGPGGVGLFYKGMAEWKEDWR